MTILISGGHLQDMNVGHSSVNGSIKINKERGYQKLPTDQEIHVIESKKIAGRKDQARTYMACQATHAR